MIIAINKYFKVIILSLASFLAYSSVLAASPDCAHTEGYATSMAFVHLKNAGITKSDEIDFDKTKTIRLASEKIKKDLYRQIHLVAFTKKSGETIQLITNNDASHEECSMSGVEVYLVSKKLGEQLPPNPSIKRDELKRAPHVKR